MDRDHQRSNSLPETGYIFVPFSQDKSSIERIGKGRNRREGKAEIHYEPALRDEKQQGGGVGK